MIIPQLPDEATDKLRELNEKADNSQWEIGDFLLDFIDEVLPAYADACFDGKPKKAHQWILNSLANDVGVDSATLRDRESVARFFPQKIRPRLDPLTYHQARAVKAAGDRWEEYLEWVKEEMNNHPNGRPPSVAKIREKIKKDQTGVMVWYSRFKKAIPILTNIAYDKDCPEKLQKEIISFIEKTEIYCD